MPKKLTTDDIKIRLENKNTVLIGEYISSRHSTEFKCTKCEFKWFTQPDHVFNGHGCPKCAGKLKLTNKIIDERLPISIKRISDFLPSFLSNKNKIDLLCIVCNHKWSGLPNDYINKKNCGCPKCKNVSRLTNEIVDSRLPKNIIRLEDYKSGNIKMNFMCLDCSYPFKATPTGIFQGKWGCPICNLNKWERLIRDLLEENKIIFKRNYFVKLNEKRYYIDFFIPEKNIAIEYNGRQHYYPVKRYGGEEKFILQQKRDEMIRNYCKDNNIKLIEFKYTLGYLKLKNEILTLIENLKESA